MRIGSAVAASICTDTCTTPTLSGVASSPDMMCCSQVSNSNCDQGFKPSTRQACNKSPCAVANPGLTLGFTAWGECSVQCGSGYSSRTAYCMNPYGLLADVSMCGNYTGRHLQVVLLHKLIVTCQLLHGCGTVCCAGIHLQPDRLGCLYWLWTTHFCSTAIQQGFSTGGALLLLHHAT